MGIVCETVSGWRLQPRKLHLYFFACEQTFPPTRHVSDMFRFLIFGCKHPLIGMSISINVLFFSLPWKNMCFFQLARIAHRKHTSCDVFRRCRALPWVCVTHAQRCKK